MQLMKRDQRDFSDFWEFSNLTDKVHYHSSTEFVVEEDDLVLVDEADAFFLSDPTSYKTFLECRTVISFTATIGETLHQKLESQIIASLKFNTACLGKWARIDKNEKPQYQRTECPTPQDGIQFIEKNRANQTILLFCTEEYL